MEQGCSGFCRGFRGDQSPIAHAVEPDRVHAVSSRGPARRFQRQARRLVGRQGTDRWHREYQGRAGQHDAVAEIVESCTDTMEERKPEWGPRKEAYVAHLAAASPLVKLVAGCDKLHNLQTTLRDLRAGQPADYWSRFTADAASQAWYYGACGKALAGSPASADFDRAYAEFVTVLKGRGDLDE